MKNEKTFYAVEVELCCGFAGWKYAVYVSKMQTEAAAEEAAKNFRGITGLKILEITAKNLAEARSIVKNNGRSLFAGSFKNMDREEI